MVRIIMLGIAGLCLLTAGIAQPVLEANRLRLEDFAGLSGWEIGGKREVRIVDDVKDGPYLEWRCQQGGMTTLTRDFTALKAQLAGCDAICFDYWFDGGASLNWMKVENVPGYDRAREWYFKMSQRHCRQWRTARFELRLDDDCPANSQTARTLLQLVFMTSSRTITGPSVWRIKNLRAVRYPVRVDYDETKQNFAETREQYRYSYALTVHNAGEVPRNCRLVFERAALRHFSLTAPTRSFQVPARQTVTLPVSLAIAKTSARGLAPLYTEEVPFVLRVNGLEETDVAVLRGWQTLPLYATVPPRYALTEHPRVRCDAQRLVALRQWVKDDPHYREALTWFRKAADDSIARPLIVPKTAGEHVMGFECPVCRGPLQIVSDIEQFCPKCRKSISGNAALNAKAVVLLHIRNANDAYYCALVYALTGETRYCDQARAILLEYAKTAPTMHPVNPISTAYSNIIGGSVLMEAYTRGFPWAYDLLRAADGLSADESRRIEEQFLLPIMQQVSLHHCGYGSQTTEMFAQETACALACGRWAMAGRALHGDFGLVDMIDHAFDAKGWAIENYMDIQSNQNLITMPMLNMTEAAELAGMPIYLPGKLPLILQHINQSTLLYTRYHQGAATAVPHAISWYEDAHLWFFTMPKE